MSQLIYALGALTVLLVFNVSIQRTALQGEREMYTDEARARLMMFARETADRITRLELPFDEQIDPDRIASGSLYPYVATPTGLTAEGDFGGCLATARRGLSDCVDLDDLHAVGPLDDDLGGLPIEYSFKVAYVDTADGSSTAGAKSYAKKLTISVETSAVLVDSIYAAGGGFKNDRKNLNVTYERVFTYPNVIDFAKGVKERQDQGQLGGGS